MNIIKLDSRSQQQPLATSGYAPAAAARMWSCWFTHAIHDALWNSAGMTIRNSPGIFMAAQCSAAAAVGATERERLWWGEEKEVAGAVYNIWLKIHLTAPNKLYVLSSPPPLYSWPVQPMKYSPEANAKKSEPEVFLLDASFTGHRREKILLLQLYFLGERKFHV